MKQFFSILTYNTHLFEGSNAVFGRALTDVSQQKMPPESLLDPIGVVETALTKLQEGVERSPIVAYDKERARELIARISELRPDVVCLQEVWAKEMQQFVKAQLREFYDHVLEAPDRGFEESQSCNSRVSGQGLFDCPAQNSQ